MLFNDDFIYKELHLPIEHRQIPTDQILRQEAFIAMQDWLNKELDARPLRDDASANFRQIIVDDFQRLSPSKQDEVVIGDLTVESVDDKEIVEEIEFFQDEVDRQSAEEIDEVPENAGDDGFNDIGTSN